MRDLNEDLVYEIEENILNNDLEKIDYDEYYAYLDHIEKFGYNGEPVALTPKDEEIVKKLLDNGKYVYEAYRYALDRSIEIRRFFRNGEKY